MKNKLILLIVLCLIFSLNGYPQVKPDGQKAWEHVNYLSSDKFKGRLSGTPEYQKAAEYVAQKMQEYGLQPAGKKKSYFQQVTFKNWRHFAQPTRLEMVAPKHMIFLPGRGADFLPNSGTGSGIIKGQLVFAGYGLIHKKSNWNDYENLDVKGKIVLIIPGSPDFLDKVKAKEKTIEAKVKTAIKQEAAGVLFMNIGQGIRGWRYASGPKKGVCPEGFLLMTANESLLDKLFYHDNQSWRYLVSRTLREKKSITAPLNIVIEMEAHFTEDTIKAPNVLGKIPGTHPQLKDEYIIIGGHLDHIGIGLDGLINNGAGDNASSIGVILEVARTLQRNNFRPDRTLIFAGWAGEELGLVGSRYYVDHPLYPLKKTVYLNMDMVGCGDEDLFVGGMWEFSDFYALLKNNMSDKFKQKLNFRIDYRGSDHSAFLSKNVTSISLRSGNPLTRELDDEHPEYHRPGDMAFTIQPELLQIAAEYHCEIITYLANTRENLLDPKHTSNFIHKTANVVDLHCDTISRYLDGEDLTQDIPKGHVDIPKLKQGAVDLQVFACYVGPPKNEQEKHQAAKKVFQQVDAVHKLVKENPNDLILIKHHDDIWNLRGNRKAGLMIGIEGGYAIENDLSLLRSFFRSGVRLMTLTHWTHTDWADASGDPEPQFGGLTELGVEVVKEMNRLGMIIDVSHVHDETFWDVIEITDSPIVASHSACRALCDHHRNMSNKMLKALKKNGGVIGICFVPSFLKTHEEGKPAPLVDVKTVVDHIEHVIKITGSKNHVGIGSDFDGTSRTPRGLEHIGLLSNITAELHKRGYKKTDIQKIMGGNFLRVFKKISEKYQE